MSGTINLQGPISNPGTATPITAPQVNNAVNAALATNYGAVTAETTRAQAAEAAETARAQAAEAAETARAQAAEALLAPLASPVFSGTVAATDFTATGTATAPTAARGTNTTQLATTAFVADALVVGLAAGAVSASSLTVTGTRLNAASLPISSDGNPPVGCQSGDIFINGGVLCIAP